MPFALLRLFANFARNNFYFGRLRIQLNAIALNMV